MQKEKFRKIVRTQNHIATIINGKLTRQVIYKNTNKVLGNGFIGLKTGTTPGAGNCVSLNFVNLKKEIDVIIILLNSGNDKQRWQDAN
jgi:D-alanyl-D-alanine carboxypeptidase